ncbi:Protein of unknown function [Escherichia coli D6-117.29]|nr:Protein of unknown function [Escherichia coli D6-117.29]
MLPLLIYQHKMVVFKSAWQ